MVDIIDQIVKLLNGIGSLVFGRQKSFCSKKEMKVRHPIETDMIPCVISAKVGNRG